jgi:putative DNA primase/helicase
MILLIPNARNRKPIFPGDLNSMPALHQDKSRAEKAANQLTRSSTAEVISFTPKAFVPSNGAEGSMLKFALDYARRGWAVFPCKPSSKAPYIDGGFKNASIDPAIITQWWRQWPEAMIGIRMGAESGAWTLDPDAPKEPGGIDGRQSWADLQQKHGAAPHTHTHNTPGGGQHLLFKYRADRPITNREGGLAKLGINVRGEGGYIIAPPSINADGKAYEIADALDFFNFADAPNWLYDLILTKPAIPEQAAARAHPPTRNGNSSHRQYAEAALRGECDRVAGALHDRNIELNNAALKLGTLVAAGELTEGEVIGPLYDAAVGNGLVAEDGPRAAMATINSGLKKGLQEPRVIPDSNYKPNGGADYSKREGCGETLAYSDEVLAQNFIDKHVADLRYTALWGQWLIWDDRRWAPDDRLATFSFVRHLCYEQARKAESRDAKNIASGGTVAAIERLARADQRIAVTVNEWDADPWLLNTPSGTVNLQTGEMRKHNPDDKLTKVTGAAPDLNCPIPLWTGLLATVTGGNSDLIAYLQRMAGYSLTGSTREHAMFFLYGTGANGKSTFLNAITACADEYHRVAPIETFTASNTERHPTELAGLRGARLVTAVETEEGRRWDESKIKALTGGDTISARFMRQDFFQYAPQFKLIIAGNHKPGLRSVDEAIRRRLNLIPFTVTIPPAARDPEFPDKLKVELPGILAWMIDGCRAWQQQGLAPPQVVTEATAAYLESEDAISAWLDECCRRDPNSFATSTHLFVSWNQWATKNGEHAGTTKKLVSALESKGFQPHRKNSGRGFVGLRVLPEYEQA